MAAMPQYLVSESLDQPKPKFVPKPSAPQGVAIHEKARRITVYLRPKERRPKQILLGTINHCDFRVVKPIPVRVDVRGETVIASWREVDEFGTGKSTSLACDDLGHTVAELYNSLKADESRLGPDLARVWAVLRAYVVSR
jgi:hypothetical protein